MYVSTSQEILRQQREDVMHAVAVARLPWTPHMISGTASRVLRNSRWELSRYMGLIAKRLRK
jgi:hypothetical protein